MKKIQIVLAAATLLAFTAGNAMAAGDTGAVLLSATIPAKATLTVIGSPTFNVSAVDSGTAVAGSVATAVTAKVRTGATGTPTLTVVAGADFLNETYTTGHNIPASDVKWTASGDLIPGTLSTTDPQTVNSAWVGSSTYSGNMTWSLANNSDYSTGTYTPITATYTLTAP